MAEEPDEHAPKRSRPDPEAAEEATLDRPSTPVAQREEKGEPASPEEQPKGGEQTTEEHTATAAAAVAPADSAAVEGTPVEAKSKAKVAKARKKQVPAEQQPEFKNKFEHLKFVVNTLSQDILLVYGGNKAAIERVRKGLTQTKTLAREVARELP